MKFVIFNVKLLYSRGCKKMKKNKAFTLIELLGVIVLIAIIAIIAVPAVTRILSGVRKSAFKQSALEFLNNADLYLYENDVVRNNMGKNGIERANKMFNRCDIWNELIKEYNSFYNNVD